MPRFRLRSVFLFVTFCAAAVGYYVNYSCVHAKCRFLISPGGEPLAFGTGPTMGLMQKVDKIAARRTVSEAELAQQTVDYLNDDEMLTELLNRPDVRSLAVMKQQEDPARWLRKRLRIRRSYRGSYRVVSMDLVHYTFIDHDNIFDRPIILRALLQMIESKICSRYPQPAGVSRCRIHQLEMPDLDY